MQNRNIKRNWSASNGQLNNLKQEVKLNDSKEPFVVRDLVYMFHNSCKFPPHHRQTIITLFVFIILLFNQICCFRL